MTHATLMTATDDALATRPEASSDERWEALRRRDPAADGRFVYSVRSTGVYCRPSCPARPARPENVGFHATCEDAERAGFRACKRCTPNGPSRDARHAALVAVACRSIEGAEEGVALDALAAEAGLSAFHFHRVFKEVTGVTPKRYGAAVRAARLAAGLQGTATVTEAVYESGYGSASGFYETATARLGMSPAAYRGGGAGAAIRVALAPCSLGTVLVAATERGVSAILIGDDPDALRHDLRARFPRAAITDGDAAFGMTVAQVVALVDDPRRGIDLPLDIGGTAFQQRVWEALRRIPAGTTVSYAELARLIGDPRAVRAVAGACAANALAVAIPCHRVVRGDGSLSGYRWGVERKRALLAREQA